MFIFRKLPPLPRRMVKNDRFWLLLAVMQWRLGSRKAEGHKSMEAGEHGTGSGRLSDPPSPPYSISHYVLESYWVLINMWNAAGFLFCMWIQILYNTPFWYQLCTTSVSVQCYKNCGLLVATRSLRLLVFQSNTFLVCWPVHLVL